MAQALLVMRQVFLVPVKILFAALGVAGNEGLKTGISFLTIATSGVWI
ncbi:MAG: hypothetical protein K2Y27_05720 [Xanthobacteraceae bacterium]|nr:hypothetical protein [Xanthobacteraceae bacterium]